ncbi:hypothetical protein AM493_11980 [Flavobacterium akiainvivens]|uniref:DUF4397 domain-containing protein n=1 Tax=Flavobacterium akiainvivens TaxID=1202724 RepID=A0A0M8MI27_9FLAO|nr:DUF4397 domain-containing protein [Flavobacterium akiainvivens]KOS06671.1 hypothetical protein AM493_11980 [Flavobacterium akiainvivens]SFQ70706.1 protein of unknown function [Flavobacterium akiainvivens]
MNFKFLSKMALCVGAAISFTSCDIDDDGGYYYQPDPNVAYGVIVNASPNSGDLFFYADANQVNNTALAYTGAEGYYNFRLGNRQLSVKNLNGETIATDSITLTAGQYFSTFAVNTFENIELVTYTDSLDYPAPNRAYVRFINLSPDAPAIDVVGVNATFAEDLEFKEATSFTEVPTGSYDLSYKNSETGEVLFSETAVNFYAGRIYTIYTKGYVTPPAGSNDTFSSELLRNY